MVAIVPFKSFLSSRCKFGCNTLWSLWQIKAQYKIVESVLKLSRYNFLNLKI